MKKVYYGWYVCAAGMLLLFMTMGVTQNGFSVFLPYIRESYGFTNTQTSTIVTARCLVAFASMTTVGIYYKKLSLRFGTFIAALLAALAFFVYSIAETYPMFLLGAALTGLSYGLGTMIPLSILMDHWFIRHRALALSICACGSGIATIFLPSLVTVLIEKFSIKTAFTVECIGVLVISIIVVLIMRDDPSDKGLKPYGSEDAKASKKDSAVSAASENAEISQAQGETLAETSQAGEAPRMTTTLWLLLGATSLFMGAMANSGFSHIPILYTSSGFSAEAVALMYSSIGVVLTLSKVVYGEVTDRIGGFKSSLLFSTILFAGNALCCLAFLGSTAICVLNVLLLGIGYPIATIGQAIWAGDLASRAEFSKVVRRLQVIYSAGSLIFSSVPGILADRFGSYTPAFIVFATCGALSVLFLSISYKLGRK